MRINLRVPSLKNLDFDNARLLVLYLFKDEIPIRELSGLCDWRLNGKISRLVVSKSFTAKFGETLLFSPGNRISVDRVLLIGLGEKKQFNLIQFRDAIRKTFSSIFNMMVEQFVLSLPRWEILKIRASQSIDIWLTELLPYVSSLDNRARNCEISVYQSAEHQRLIVDPILNFTRRFN